MANRDDYRGYGGDRGREGGRWDDQRRMGQRGGGEGRSFDETGRFNSDQARYGQGSRGGSEGEREPWRRDRYGSRFDQDRTNYGSGYDRDRGDYGRGYGGQEYGMEGRGGRGGGQSGPQSGRQGDKYGIREFGMPHDYNYEPEPGHELDPEYMNWRDEQLRAHDRDYHEWRQHQHRQYDEDYRKFRSERREHFGKSFHEWRSQRNASTGMAQQHITPETGDYASRMQQGFGHGSDQPSGMLEPMSAMTPSPTLTQGGGGHGSAHGSGQGSGQSSEQATQSGGAGGSEFGHTTPQVQAASDGGDTRGDAENRTPNEDRTDQSRH